MYKNKLYFNHIMCSGVLKPKEYNCNITYDIKNVDILSFGLLLFRIYSKEYQLE